MKNFLLLMLCLAAAANAYSQKSTDMLSVKDMQADIDYYYNTLKEVHPYPYHVLSKEQWDRKIDSLKASITSPMTERDFLAEMKKLSVYLDLHSSIAAPKKIRKKMSSPLIVPQLTETDGRVFFTDSLGGNCEMKTLDGKPLQQIRTFCQERFSSIEPIKGMNFLDCIRHYCSAAMITDSVIYTYTDSHGREHTAYIKRNMDKKDKTYKSSREYNITFDSTSSIAIMEINTFMPSKSNFISFQNEVKTMFDSLAARKTDTLIIDVSCNGGGSLALVNWLTGFFTEGTNLYAGTWTQKFSKHRDRQKLDWLTYPGSSEEYIQRKTYFNPSLSMPKFKGTVYVLQSRNSFSGAAIFSAMMQHYVKKCRIIGEEGEIKAFYADPLMFTMPKSKLTFTVSSMFGRFVGKDKNLGTVPDIPVKIYNTQHIFSIDEIREILNNNNNNNNNNTH